jgi:hypothetical protein
MRNANFQNGDCYQTGAADEDIFGGSESHSTVVILAKFGEIRSNRL